MKNLTALVFLLTFIFGFAQNERELDYIRTYAKLAVEEMHLYNIPASITLSQGIIETGGGQSRLAEQAFNHFGIKCKTEWTGGKIYHDDDKKGECFRVYDSPLDSYRDHSLFLAERPYYKDLFKLDMYDYSAWAYGLRKAGYATNKKYPTMLISKIEKYGLDRFDRMASEEVDAMLVELYGPTDIIALTHYRTSEPKEVLIAAMPEPKERPVNDKEIRKIQIEKREKNPVLRFRQHGLGMKYITAYENETFESLGALYGINPEVLASYNELPVNGKIIPGQPIYFEKKKNSGIVDHYTVQEGDSMYLIAQSTGMRINKLYNLNNLHPGDQPAAGTVLNLRKNGRIF